MNMDRENKKETKMAHRNNDQGELDIITCEICGNDEERGEMEISSEDVDTGICTDCWKPIPCWEKQEILAS